MSLKNYKSIFFTHFSFLYTFTFYFLSLAFLVMQGKTPSSTNCILRRTKYAMFVMWELGIKINILFSFI